MCHAHEARDPSSEGLELLENWEAELLGSIKALDVSAVCNHMWDIVPDALKATWLLILKRHQTAFKAQQSFWDLQLAVPVRHLRHSQLQLN